MIFAAPRERFRIVQRKGVFHVNAGGTPFEFVTVSYLTRIGNHLPGHFESC